MFFNNNIYAGEVTTEMQIQELKTAITDLENTRVLNTEYVEDQLRITALETKTVELDTKLNTAITNVDTMKIKIEEQGQVITSLKK